MRLTTRQQANLGAISKVWPHAFALHEPAARRIHAASLRVLVRLGLVEELGYFLNREDAPFGPFHVRATRDGILLADALGLR